MFTYEDGSAVHVGDSVLLEQGKTPGTVELLVVTAEDMSSIGVQEPGLMLSSPPFGRVFLPDWSLRKDPLKLVSRGLGQRLGGRWPHEE